eukprot:COSAG01_NODE_13763_length_1538_cov_2.806810_1_plen_51_part_10
MQVEILGPGNYENVGESQSVLMMIDPMIFTRTRRGIPVAAKSTGKQELRGS